MSAPPPLVPAALVSLFAVGTACGFYLLSRAVATRPTASAHGDAVAAAARARSDLDALTDAAGSPSHYAQMAAILRDFLDARFALDSESMPGADIERAITRAGTSRASARLAAHFIERCMLIQTATTAPAPARVAEDIRTAREIIDLLA